MTTPNSVNIFTPISSWVAPWSFALLFKTTPPCCFLRLKLVKVGSRDFFLVFFVYLCFELLWTFYFLLVFLVKLLVVSFFFTSCLCFELGSTYFCSYEVVIDHKLVFFWWLQLCYWSGCYYKGLLELILQLQFCFQTHIASPQ